jgi:hypothetical protein
MHFAPSEELPLTKGKEIDKECGEERIEEVSSHVFLSQ